MSIKIYAQIPKTISKTNKNYYGTKKNDHDEIKNIN